MNRLAPSRLLAAFVALLALDASADTTGFWSDPAQPGWGLALAEQDGTTFGTLLVYDPGGGPTWFVASGLVPLGTDTNPPSGAPLGLTGTLYRTTGSAFTLPFDPSALHVQPAGILQVLFPDRNAQPESLHVTYSVDGRVVEKTVRRQTWASNLGKLAGISTYEGGLYVTATSGTCEPLAFTPQGRPFVFQVSANEQGSRVRMLWGTGIDTGCTLDGTYEQRGQFGAITGPLLCGPLGGATLVLVAQLEGLQVNEHGFTGAATVTRGACTYTGHVGGVKQGM